MTVTVAEQTSRSRKQRYWVLAVLCSAYLLCYLDRMAIVIALPFIAKELQLSAFSMGAVLSAFFMGYSIMQVPGGLLADKFGPNRVMTGSIVGWSVFTALTGSASSLPSLLAIRALFGMAEGPYPPTASKAVAIWFAPHEVGRANAIQLASVNVGAAIAPLVVAPLIVTWGWRPVFMSLLVPGMMLALIIRMCIKDRAATSVQHESQSARAGTRPSFKECLRMPAVFWCSVALFFGNIGGWGLMNWLPTYLLQAREFGIEKTGLFSALPFLAGALGYSCGGQLSDKYFNRKRHVPIVAGFLLSGAMTYAAAVAPSGEWAVAALVLVFLSLFTALGGIFTLPLVIVPAHSVGSVFGIVNTCGQVAAFLSPLIIGYTLDATNKDFVVVFFLLVGLFVVAAGAATRIAQRAQQTTSETA